MRYRWILPLVLLGCPMGIGSADSIVRGPPSPESVEESIQERPWFYDDQMAAGPDGTLVEKSGHIYYRSAEDQPLVYLMPGTCPQWYPEHEGWFYVFIPVGYDSLKEIWLGTTNGRLLGKVCEGKFFINSTPIVQGRYLLHLIRPLMSVQSGRSQVRCIILPENDPDGVAEARHLYQTIHHHGSNSQSIRNLRFVGEHRVAFEVHGTHATTGEGERRRYQMNVEIDLMRREGADP